ncbi:MAG TPA: hypothetical protein PKZ64_17345 [Spirochaetota bacterium]|jgi:hypothetical protein|nr:hypothetical protein [Spirochaetota bacterium]HPJ43935.1 hypothetical protein [Spirochaetota bacterium]
MNYINRGMDGAYINSILKEIDDINEIRDFRWVYRDGEKYRTIKRKPGVKPYIVRFNRIEEGMMEHPLFTVFVSLFIIAKLVSIGTHALFIIIPPLLFYMLRFAVRVKITGRAGE